MRPGDIVHHACSGEEYVRDITRHPDDRLARTSFQRLAASLAPPGAQLLDFGAGPGIDAHHFAGLGYRVRAYDASPRMREYFVLHCREFLASGRIALEAGGYREFLERARRRAPSDACAASDRDVDLVVANFAPFSLVADLSELFEALHALTRPGGRILASILNAYFWRDVKYPWWLRRLPRLMRDGSYSLSSPEGPLARRRLAEIAARAQPWFTLARVYPGLWPETAPIPPGFDAAKIGVRPFVGLMRTRFTFLVFERDRATSPAPTGTQ
jgi:SAM-dependent methyltransferase